MEDPITVTPEVVTPTPEEMEQILRLEEERKLAIKSRSHDMITEYIKDSVTLVSRRISDTPTMENFNTRSYREIYDVLDTNDIIPATLDHLENGASEHWIQSFIMESAYLRSLLVSHCHDLQGTHFTSLDPIVLHFNATHLADYVNPLQTLKEMLEVILLAHEDYDYSLVAADAAQVTIAMAAIKSIISYHSLVSNTHTFLDKLACSLGEESKHGIGKAKPQLAVLYKALGISSQLGRPVKFPNINTGAFNIAAVMCVPSYTQQAYSNSQSPDNRCLSTATHSSKGMGNSSIAIASALSAIATVLHRIAIRKRDPLSGSGLEYATSAMKALTEGTTKYRADDGISRVRYRSGAMPTLCDATDRLDSIERAVVYPNILGMLRDRLSAKLRRIPNTAGETETTKEVVYRMTHEARTMLTQLCFRLGEATDGDTPVARMMLTQDDGVVTPRLIIDVARQLSSELYGELYGALNGLNNVIINPAVASHGSNTASITAQDNITEFTSAVTDDPKADATLVKAIRRLSRDAHKAKYGDAPTCESSLNYPSRTVVMSFPLTRTMLKASLFPVKIGLSRLVKDPSEEYLEKARENITLDALKPSSAFGAEGDLARQIFKAFKAEEAIRISGNDEAQAIRAANTALGNKLLPCFNLFTDRGDKYATGSAAQAVAYSEYMTVFNTISKGRAVKSEIRRKAWLSMIENGVAMNEIWGDKHEVETFQHKDLLRHMKYDTSYRGDDNLDNTTLDSILGHFIADTCKKRRFEIVKAVAEEHSLLGIGSMLSYGILDDFRNFMCEWFGVSHSSNGLTFLTTNIISYRNTRRTTGRVHQEEIFYVPTMETMEEEAARDTSSRNRTGRLNPSMNNSVNGVGVHPDFLRSGVRMFGGVFTPTSIPPSIDKRYKDIAEVETQHAYFNLVILGALLEAMDAWVESREGKRLITTETAVNTRTLVANTDHAFPFEMASHDITSMTLEEKTKAVDRKPAYKGTLCSFNGSDDRFVHSANSKLAASNLGGSLAITSRGRRSVLNSDLHVIAPSIPATQTMNTFTLGTMACGSLNEMNGAKLALSTEEISMAMGFGVVSDGEGEASAVTNGLNVTRSLPIFEGLSSAGMSSNNITDALLSGLAEVPGVDYSDVIDSCYSFEFRYNLFDEFEEASDEFKTRKFSKLPFSSKQGEVAVTFTQEGLSTLPVMENLDIRDLSDYGFSSAVFGDMADGLDLAYSIKSLTHKIV